MRYLTNDGRTSKNTAVEVRKDPKIVLLRGVVGSYKHVLRLVETLQGDLWEDNIVYNVSKIIAGR